LPRFHMRGAKGRKCVFPPSSPHTPRFPPPQAAVGDTSPSASARPLFLGVRRRLRHDDSAGIRNTDIRDQRAIRDGRRHPKGLTPPTAICVGGMWGVWGDEGGQTHSGPLHPPTVGIYSMIGPQTRRAAQVAMLHFRLRLVGLPQHEHPDAGGQAAFDGHLLHAHQTCTSPTHLPRLLGRVG